MKKLIKIMALALAFVATAALCSSCEEKDDGPVVVESFWYYDIHQISTTYSDFSAVTSQLKYIQKYGVSQSDSQTEWNRFISAVDDSKVVADKGSLEITLNWYANEKANPVKIGSKTWK